MSTFFIRGDLDLAPFIIAVSQTSLTGCFFGCTEDALSETVLDGDISGDSDDDIDSTVFFAFFEMILGEDWFSTKLPSLFLFLTLGDGELDLGLFNEPLVDLFELSPSTWNNL